MAAIRFQLRADTSAFTAAMRQASANLRQLQEEIGRALLPALSELAARVAEWCRIQGSRDTRQVACPGDRLNPEMHEFWITRGYACPGCGAAL